MVGIKRVRCRDVVAVGGMAVAALLACGGVTPFMELPEQEKDMYSACSDEAADWCLEKKFGMPPLLTKTESVRAAEINVELAKKREQIAEAHVDDCVGEFGEDGIARTEYVNKGTAEKRKAWLLSIGCSEAKMAKAKDLPKD